MEQAVIVAALRTPIARSYKGSFANTRMDDIASQLIEALLAKIPELPKERIEDVLIGCAMPEGEQGLNIARNISFLAGLPFSCGAVTINRFCGSSLSAISMAAESVMVGNGDIFIAGGVESMTHVPMGGFNPSMNERLMKEGAPAAYIGVGETAENLAKKFKISRESQDKFAYESHLKAAAAWGKGYFVGEVVPITARASDGGEFEVKIDECVRRDTTIEKLMELKPSFLKDGTVTAGNSSPLSDGAAAVIVMSKTLAKKLKIKPLVTIAGTAVAGVDPAYMGIGPVEAVPKALLRAGVKLKNIDLIELNEAFAAQSLAVVDSLELENEKLNIHGGAIAIGHPLGCSGARITTTLIHAMERYDKNHGLATMCIGGGQGIAMVVVR